MATELKIWQIANDGLIPVADTAFESNHIEQQLENWIAKDPAILGEDLLIIDRQRSIEGVGRLDLLCIDATGALVIVELKRDSTPREAIAQALDYASWLNSRSDKEITDFAEGYLKKPLAVAFLDRFKEELPDLDCQNHRIVLAAPRLDASAERIIDYLASRHEVGINAVFFKYVKLAGGEEILARSVLVPDAAGTPEPPSIQPATPSIAELLTIADSRKVRALVDICRGMSAVWDEWPSNQWGGSFSYSLAAPVGWRMLCRTNVAGNKRSSPEGTLDVWIWFKNIAEVGSVDPEVIGNTLANGHPQLAAFEKYRIIRLTTSDQAENLVQQLKAWVSGTPSQPAVA
jgi:hypothetical protein